MANKQEKKPDTQTTEQFLFEPTKLKAKHALNGERIKRVLELLHFV